MFFSKIGLISLKNDIFLQANNLVYSSWINLKFSLSVLKQTKIFRLMEEDGKYLSKWESAREIVRGDGDEDRFRTRPLVISFYGDI